MKYFVSVQVCQNPEPSNSDKAIVSVIKEFHHNILIDDRCLKAMSNCIMSAIEACNEVYGGKMKCEFSSGYIIIFYGENYIHAEKAIAWISYKQAKDYICSYEIGEKVKDSLRDNSFEVFSKYIDIPEKIF